MSKEPSSARVVLVSHPEEGATAFARSLVERGLVACVNLLPVTSVYRWEGAVTEDSEVLLIAKTGVARIAELERFVKDEHPYDVPELVALAPEHVERGYLAWVLEQTRAGAVS